MSTLPQLLRDKLIPWAANSANQRIIVARPIMKAGELPDNAELKPHKIPGKRIIMKNQRIYANARELNAHWPEAQLNEIENPKLICVTRGRTAYQVHNYLVQAGEGSFIFLPPGTPHPDGTASHAPDDTGYCELLNIILRRNAVQAWLCLSENEQHFDSPSENYLLRNEKVVQLLKLATAEAIDGEDQYQVICGNLLHAFFTALLREVQAGRYTLARKKSEGELQTRSQLDFSTTIREYIQSHLHEPLTLEDAARYFYLSRAQFARRIKSETGKTFVQILTECRIAEAKSLLDESDWSSVAIAEFVGFKSVTYFHSLFVQEAGITPGKFREAQRKAAHDTPGDFDI